MYKQPPRSDIRYKTVVWSLGDHKNIGWHGVARSLQSAWDAAVHLINTRPTDEWDWRFWFEFIEFDVGEDGDRMVRIACLDSLIISFGRSFVRSAHKPTRMHVHLFRCRS